ncbi:MAG: PIG-L family deacetylase, partial [bacterium]|nr:PIG-L family deacetylase [bacterium]
IAAVRRQEARAAGALIGAEYACAEFRDLAVFNDDVSRRHVTALLRRHRPDMVLTSSPTDYMCDHEITSDLVRDACFGAPAPNYSTSEYDAAPALAGIPHLYFMDPIGGADRAGNPVTPDFTVDVSSTFATKRAMLASHASQREWLRRQHGIDEYLDAMERWTRARGNSTGLEFGEGFRQYKGHPYPTSPLLQELVADSAA